VQLETNKYVPDVPLLKMDWHEEMNNWSEK
jgi:hypothetical protein